MAVIYTLIITITNCRIRYMYDSLLSWSDFGTNRTVYRTVHFTKWALKWLFLSILAKIFRVLIKKSLKYHKFCYDIGNRTSCHPIRSVIILTIKQIRLPLRGRPILLIMSMITDRIGRHEVLLLRGRPILLITCMITDRIGLHSVLLPLLIKLVIMIYYFHKLILKIHDKIKDEFKHNTCSTFNN